MEGSDLLFACEGEMARRMAEHDWAGTPLGPSASWSHDLRTSVALLLRSRYPMLLTWGEPLVMLYNDAFIPTLGAKHPHSLGGLLTVEFAEVWDDIGDMQRSVLAGGPATWAEDLPLTIERGGGPEQAYFTFSYSHVPDENGPGGVLAVLAMTTDKVVAANRLALLNELASVGNESHDPAEVVAVALDVLARAARELRAGAFYEPAGPAGVDLVRRASFGETCAGVLPETVRAPDHPVASAWRERRTVEDRHVCADHEDRSVLSVALPVRGQDETGAVLVLCPHPLRPFDEHHQGFLALVADRVGQMVATASERAREQARLEALAALDAAKTAFLSNVSHEFRTPLTLLLGPLEDVLGGRLDALELADVEEMHASAHRLLRMVNGLLDVARIEAGGVRATLEATDLAALTGDLLQPFESAAARAGVGLESRLDPAVGVVGVDPGLWEKIVLNLVSNALKFTRDGQITVELGRVDDGVRLRVVDTGVGIPEAEVGRVFERFHRVHHAGGRTIEGTGIGLALVAEAAQSMGGRATVTSEHGSGSTFEVLLPLVEDGSRPADTHARHHAAAEAHARDLVPAVGAVRLAKTSSDLPDDDRPVILVVEDNPAMQARVARVLGELGAVITAGDGRQALEILRARRVDLVVTDVMMPELDGLGLLQEIRADVLLRSMPVVLLSARAGTEAAAGAVEAGADDYVVKPFTTGELLARCRTTLELAEYRASDAAGRARSALLAGVSHDMQTPLAVITSTLELLSEDEMTAPMRMHTAERARARASQLTQLVTQFLDWSRLSMNEPLPIRVRASDLREAADHVAADHPRARVECDLSRVPAACDPQRTEQILHNLVDNAEKVAGSSITIRIDVAEAAIVVRVIDDGSGVDPEVLPHLFEAFGPSAATSGNGLGLHVSREAARAQGGDLVLEDTGPQGTVFALTVPREVR